MPTRLPKGGCSCGKLQFTAAGNPQRVGICHCLDCQKHHGAAFYAAAVFAQSDVRVTGVSHDHAGRHFCPACGSSVFAVTGTEVELHLGAMDDPSAFTPEYKLWTIRRAAWLAPVAGATQYQCGRNA